MDSQLRRIKRHTAHVSERRSSKAYYDCEDSPFNARITQSDLWVLESPALAQFQTLQSEGRLIATYLHYKGTYPHSYENIEELDLPLRERKFYYIFPFIPGQSRIWKPGMEPGHWRLVWNPD